MKKQLLTLLVFMMLPLVASADPVEINGIWYNLVTKAKQAEVTSNPNKYTGNIVIPETVTYQDVSYSVTNIGNYAFDYSTRLTSVTIPNSVTSIGNCAFRSCIGLTSVTIPNSVTSIGGYTFSDCTSLTSITIPNSVTYIGIGAFKECKSLTSITIPNSLRDINENTFYDCSGLTSITISNSVKYIGSRAFYGCSNLSTVTIPNSVTCIGSRTFENCLGLTSVTFCNSVCTIGSCTFLNCSKLTSITLPNSLPSIDDNTFQGCTSLSTITIPNGVASIGSSAFSGCTSLTSVTIPNSVTSIGNLAFYNCSHLNSITIPDGVSQISFWSFNGCKSLTYVSLGSGTYIVENQSFAYCPNLTDVTCYAEKVPMLAGDAFDYSYIEYATLHVPSASINAYKEAENWKNFKSIVATDGETPEPPTTQKCEKPTISYENGQLKFASATDGVEFVSEITDSDIKKNYEATVSLAATYNITVYATKSGYDNSDVATATLCWVDASPKTEGITNGVANIPANAVLIQSAGGTITVQGCDEGEQVSVYGINGTQAGKSISQNGAAIVNTNLQPGSIAIVKIGQKSVKVAIK